MKKLLLLLLFILILSPAFAEAFTLKGVVVDEYGEPIIGGNVIVKGTTRGVTTDIDGLFQIEVSEGEILVFSYLGYDSQEYIVRKEILTVTITMKEDNMTLDEVVVISYGVTKRISTSSSKSKKPMKAKVDKSKVGLLTATEINDFSKWMIWDSIVVSNFSEVKQTWQMLPKNRYVGLLKNINGLPIVDAVVQLKNNANEVIWESRTDNTGKAELWADLYTLENNKVSSYTLSFKYADTENIIQAVPFTEGINTVTIDVNCNDRNEVDIMFVVDATGSMGDEISFLQNELHDILNKVKKNIKDVDMHVGSVFYRDHGDEYLTRSIPLSSDVKNTINFIQAQSANGGGDYPEALDEALYHAIELGKWREEALSRIVFLVLDAPAHDNPENVELLQQQIKLAAQKGIRIVPIICSGMDVSGEFLMRCMALATNGTSVYLTDDSGIGNAHIKPKTDKYEVEILNDLLLRVIDQYTRMPDCESEKWIKEFAEAQASDKFVPNPYDEENKDGKSKLKAKDVMTVYPNPCTDILKVDIKGDVTDLFVVDMSGKSLVKYNPLEGETMEINMSGYSSGVYFVKVYCEGKWFTEKVILR